MKNWRNTLGWLLQIVAVILAVTSINTITDALLGNEYNRVLFMLIVLAAMFFGGKTLKKRAMYYCNHCGTKGLYSSYRESDPRLEVEKTTIQDTNISYVSDMWVSVATDTTYQCPKCGSSWSITRRRRA